MADGMFTDTDGTMPDDVYSAMADGMEGKSDDYLAGYAEGVMDAVKNAAEDLTEIALTSLAMGEFLTERARRNAEKTGG